MKYYLVVVHPSGDALVKNNHGQERWLKFGTYIINKDRSVTIIKKSPLTTL